MFFFIFTVAIYPPPAPLDPFVWKLVKQSARAANYVFKWKRLINVALGREELIGRGWWNRNERSLHLEPAEHGPADVTSRGVSRESVCLCVCVMGGWSVRREGGVGIWGLCFSRGQKERSIQEPKWPLLYCVINSARVNRWPRVILKGRDSNVRKCPQSDYVAESIALCCAGDCVCVCRFTCT